MKYINSIFVITALVYSCHTFAHEAGDMIVRAGVISVNPDETSDPIDVAGLVTLEGVTIDSNAQLGLTGVYMLTDNIGLELLAATPFTHDIFVKGTSLQAGDAKHLPPTLSLQYYAGDAMSKFRPYVGLGINTTIFFSENVNNDLNSALDSIVGLPAGTVDADLELEQSWGLSAQLGFDYMLNEKWMINGAAWYIDINTEAAITTAVATVKFDVEVDPWVYLLSVGYKL